MEKQILANRILYSPSEMLRMMYAWFMKFFLTVGNILGWTITLSIALTNFSIKVLPFVLLVNALFAITGMLLFSVLINYIQTRNLIIVSSILSIISIITASFFYDNKIVLLVFVLIASGLFITQISILLANHLEDFFSPREAERLFPKIDSAETIGGIVAGLMLVFLGFALMSYKLLWLWAIFTIAFLFIFVLIVPEIPPELVKNERNSEQFKKRLKFNGLVQGVKEIKRTPFLQLLLYVSVINWVIAQLVEFEFAKAVNDSILSHGSLLEHEIALTYGLGSLQILFHSSALIIELLVASRLLQVVGTLGGFLIHAILTFISGLAVLFSFGYLSAVLLRNNFEISSIIHKTSYDTSYYAFRYGTQKPIREIFEGLFMPFGVIIGTLLLIGIQLFFMEDHYILAINLFLIFLVVAMVFVSFHLKDKYVKLAKINLYSNVPLEKHHAIEVLGQMGHEDAIDELCVAFKQSKDDELKLVLFTAITSKGQTEILPFLLDVIKKEKLFFSKLAMRSLEKIILKGAIRELSPAIKRKLMNVVLGSIEDKDTYKSYLALRIAIFLDKDRVRSMRLSVRLRTLVEYLIAEHESDQDRIESFRKRLITEKRLDYLSEIARHSHNDQIKNKFVDYLISGDDEMRLYANYGLMNMKKYSSVREFINLLLFTNNVIFKKSLSKMENLSEKSKIIIKNNLLGRSSVKSIPRTSSGKRAVRRIMKIYNLID